MGSTTLVTFLFDCPAAARTIELLGSWDNFTKPYSLKRDRRRGHGIWSGCYIFEDIICDGDFDSVGGRRNGALKMGGTYWYYYKVDDEEHHNPSEPSTTVCPLLPGQRLNVLEVPIESRSRSNSESDQIFTRNPQDKFLTPVPPKPLPSPKLGDLCTETYRIPLQSLGGPRSATYPSMSQSLTPGYERRARSASTSPAMPSSALFPDLKSLKVKLASKRSASNNREQPRNVRELQIGAPTLISTTAEEVNLVPLSSLQAPSTSSSVRTRSVSSPAPLITAKLREFSPLGSHPVDPVKDLIFASEKMTPAGAERLIQRPRSHVPEISATEPPSSPGIVRANSSETRRTKIFCNEPWLASPRLRQSFEEDSEEAKQRPEPALVLQRPTLSLEPPSHDSRPSSSHGSHRSPGLRQTPLDKDKALPALPRYLVPAPLFACNGDAISVKEYKEREKAEDGEEEHQDDSEIRLISERSGQFSTWSSDSITFSSPTSDEDAVHSPTFSSLTSNCSEMGSPQRLSARFSISDYMVDQDEESAIKHEKEDDEQNQEAEEASTQTYLSTSPPQLDQLRLSGFGSSLFNIDIRATDSTSRRQVSCFGLGFQGYKLPEDEVGSQATLTKDTLPPEPTIKHGRESSVSHFEKLMNDFGYLGDSVL